MTKGRPAAISAVTVAWESSAAVAALATPQWARMACRLPEVPYR